MIWETSRNKLKKHCVPKNFVCSPHRTTPQFPSKIIWHVGVFQKLIRVFHSTQFSTLSLVQCCKCMLKHLNQLIVTTLSNVKITSKGKSLITNKSWNFPLFPARMNYLPYPKTLKHFCLDIDFQQFCKNWTNRLLH